MSGTSMDGIDIAPVDFPPDPAQFVATHAHACCRTLQQQLEQA